MGNVVWTMGNNQLIYQYQQSKDGQLNGSALAQPKCDVNSLAWQYNFSRRTFFLAQYTKVDNKRRSRLRLRRQRSHDRQGPGSEGHLAGPASHFLIDAEQKLSEGGAGRKPRPFSFHESEPISRARGSARPSADGGRRGVARIVRTTTAARPSPCADREVPASQEDRRLSAGLMRVNHTGEVCAQALYSGQALVAA
jgi:hypothetical protein